MSSKDPIKEQILEAALQLMNTMGYGALTISELARRTKISKQRLYYHYPSLDEVLLTLAERWSESGQACTIKALAKSNDVGARKIVAIGEGMFDWMSEYRDLSRLALVLYQSGPQIKKIDIYMETARQTARQRIKSYLEQDLAFKKLSKAKMEKAVVAIHSLLYGFFLYVAAFNDFEELESHRANCREALIRLIDSYSGSA